MGAFGPSQQTILERIASQIAPAVANVQLYEEIKEEIAVVNQVSRVITSAINIEEVYGKFALELKKLVDFERASINLVDSWARSRSPGSRPTSITTTSTQSVALPI